MSKIIQIVAFLVVVFSVYKVYMSGKKLDESRKEANGIDIANQAYLWVREKIEEYSKESLSYCINKECVKQDVPNEIVDKLREEYGNEVVCPMFNIAGAFLGKFHADLSFLNEAFKRRCDENGVEYEDNASFEQLIAEYILKQQEQKAKEIIKQHIEK